MTTNTDAVPLADIQQFDDALAGYAKACNESVSATRMGDARRRVRNLHVRALLSASKPAADGLCSDKACSFAWVGPHGHSLAPAAPAQSVKNCQTGWADFCLMAKHDGVMCPDDSCDIDDGIRAGPAQSVESVAWRGLPEFPKAMWNCGGVDLFTEHQLQGYANAALAASPVYPYIYEYETAFGLHRQLEPGTYNGSDPTRTVKVYAAPQPSPTAVVLDDERAAFEAALPKISPHRENGYDLTRSGPNLSGDDYFDEDIQTQWRVWQARAAFPQPVAQTDDARDAARYRWLREHWGYLSETYDADSSRMVSIDLLQDSFIEDGWDVEPASLDAAVDVNLTAAQPASGGEQ